MTHTVTFLQSGRAPTTVAVTPGSTLLKAVLRARLPIGRSCRGTGVCAACHVAIVAGAEHLDAPNAIEAALPARPDERYACLARLRGDVTITTAYW